MAKPNKYDVQHLRNLGLTEKQIEKIYDLAVKEAAAIGASIHDFNPDKPFSFADYPQTKARIDKLVKQLPQKVETVIVNGARSEWTLANDKNNALCDLVFGNNKSKLTREQERKYYSNNDKALDAFLKRKTAGLNLSDRVWKYTDQFKTEIEMGLDLGLRDGVSAAEMARELKQYLQYPDKLFRRVRDEHGQLHLSKAAKEFHPGQGVYRSSYKNAMRLARTENNMAYRTADHERWQQLDFVVGIEIRLSNNHTLNGRAFTDICDDLQGKYPKDFKFTGWHPACRCHAVSILKTPDELMQENEDIMDGKEPDTHSANEVKEIPDNFKKWIADNKDRITRAEREGTLPYFIKDNYKDGSVDNGFARELGKRIKTNAEKADIQKRWDNRKKQNEVKSKELEKLTKNGDYNTIVSRRIEYVEFDKDFIKLLDDKIKINVVNKANSGSWWSNAKKEIVLDNIKRRVKSTWFNKALVYHEGGHGIADNKLLLYKKELLDIYNKHTDAVKNTARAMGMRLKSLYKRFDKMDEAMFTKRGISKGDVLEQILSTADTLSALTEGLHGFGHTYQYFQNALKRRHEYMAHAFENRFVGNAIFKKYMPEIYEDMIKYINTIISQ
jgi:hypothetical protein